MTIDYTTKTQPTATLIRNSLLLLTISIKIFYFFHILIQKHFDLAIMIV